LPTAAPPICRLPLSSLVWQRSTAAPPAAGEVVAAGGRLVAAPAPAPAAGAGDDEDGEDGAGEGAGDGAGAAEADDEADDEPDEAAASGSVTEPLNEHPVRARSPAASASDRRVRGREVMPRP
jgi:hypothetical protein